MTKHLKISIIILALFIIYAPSCVDEQAIGNREEAILVEAKTTYVLNLKPIIYPKLLCLLLKQRQNKNFPTLPITFMF
ncbi:MAG: hypothetical protein B6D64_09855 [Bacteroidetes bacterium 4484_276]|nr:MAG: hypothetical protein B6D64_09855 [Bacteroidetes bacterium 4484_276]